MRTAVLSDLHLGTGSGGDVLRRPAVVERLLEAVAGSERIVLLGDVIELREHEVDAGIELATPLLAALGTALAPGGEVVIVPGNHDHGLADPLLADRDPGALSTSTHEFVGPGHRLGPLAAALGAHRLRVAYPGVWLRPDVYAMHGHWMDVHSSVPTFECLAIASVARARGGVPAAGARPEEYERLVAPVYRTAYRAALALGNGNGSDLSARLWERLAPSGGEPAAGSSVSSSGGAGGMRSLLGSAVLGGVRLVNDIGLGPFDADLSGPALRRSGLRAVGEVVARLDLRAEHVIFGHTHRGGPRANDDSAEWRAPNGARLLNPGSWVHAPAFVRGGPGSPYWPGGLVLLDATGPPRIVRLLDDLAL